MTNIFLFLILACLVFTCIIIYRIFLVVREPKIDVPSVPAAITRGSYAPVVASSNDSEVGISEAKTPQLVEFEAEQELLKKNQSLGR